MTSDHCTKTLDDDMARLVDRLSDLLEDLGLPGNELGERKHLEPLLTEAVSAADVPFDRLPHGGHQDLRCFPAVKNFDFTLMHAECGLVLGELKHSTAIRSAGLMFEQAWDAVKLALARVEQADVARGYIICGGYGPVWAGHTSCADLFEDSLIDPVELWQRPISDEMPAPAGPDGWITVGADLEAGGPGRIACAPEYLGITHIATKEMKLPKHKEPWLLKCAAVEPRGELREWPLPHAPFPPGGGAAK
ncbi:MAG: hypothetical protein WCJ63_04170 [Actinomycetes bacterium]